MRRPRIGIVRPLPLDDPRNPDHPCHDEQWLEVARALAGCWPISIGTACTGENMKSAVAYARFSTDLQKETSIEDQAALCEEIAARNGFKVIKVYSDRAKSGASMFERDGLLALMKAAQDRQFDAVITESLSRLSRDQEDTAGIYKRLKFREIQIIDSNGEISDVHVGVGGIVNSMFLTNLANAVRRGINGRVRKGLVPGTLTYGYRLIPGRKGEREIDPAQAAIVRRIFAEYADGKSAREIALDLTRNGIPTPRGNTEWNHNSIAARSKAKGGMIDCQLYAGRLVWNVHRSVLNPETGRKIQRRSKPEDVMVTEVPHLRIIDEDLWNRAHKVQAERASPSSYAPRRPTTNIKTKENHVLGGLLVCERCGQHMVVMQTTADDARVACSAASLRSTCEHKRSYSMKELERNIIANMKAKLTSSKALVELTKEYHFRWAERQKEARGERDKVARELTRTTVAIDRYVTAIGETDEPVKGLVDKIKALEVDRVALEARLKLIDAEGDGAKGVVSLHPVALDRFRQNIETIHAALTGGMPADAAAPFRAAFRNVFERIVVHETVRKQPYAVTPYARLSAILGIELFPKARTAEEMLAEQGVKSCLTGEAKDSQFRQTSLY
jgi:site-specific DNA recombinase